MKKKILRVKLVGHDYVTAWKNEKKEGNQPDYKGDGIAVWVDEVEVKTKEEDILEV